MAIVTKTFDSDEWRLVPRKATDAMKKAAQDCHECDNGHIKYGAQYIYSAMLAAAPQPDELSPWLPIESAPKDGLFLAHCGVFQNPKWVTSNDPAPFFMIIHGKTYWQSIGSDAKGYMPIAECKAATHWTPLPQPPEVK